MGYDSLTVNVLCFFLPQMRIYCACGLSFRSLLPLPRRCIHGVYTYTNPLWIALPFVQTSKKIYSGGFEIINSDKSTFAMITSSSSTSSFIRCTYQPKISRHLFAYGGVMLTNQRLIYGWQYMMCVRACVRFFSLASIVISSGCLILAFVSIQLLALRRKHNKIRLPHSGVFVLRQSFHS